MATKNITPRNNDEGQIGTSSKKWASAHISNGVFDTLTVGGASVTGGGGGSPDLISEGQAKVETIDTGTDARIEFYVDPNDDGTASKAWEITENGHLLPGTNDTFDIGSAELKVRDLYVSQNSLWLGDDHKLSIRAGKISHKKRKKSSGYQPRAFLVDNLNRGSFDRDKLLAIKKISNGGDGTGTGVDGAAANETELTLSDWVRYANASEIDGVAVTNRFRSSKSGGPQEGKWTANDIFDEDEDFEEIVDPSSAVNLDLTNFSSDAKATNINDSAPSETKLVTETAVKSHVDTKLSQLTLDSLSGVNTEGVQTGQILKYNGTNWAPAEDGGGSGGGGGSRSNVNVISAFDFSSNTYTISDSTSSDLEIIYLINSSDNSTKTITLPTAASSGANNKLVLQIKRIGTDPVNIIAASGQTIDGSSSSFSLPHRYSSLTFVCAEGSWWII